MSHDDNVGDDVATDRNCRVVVFAVSLRKGMLEFMLRL